MQPTAMTRLVLAAAALCALSAVPARASKVMLLSLDGFRWDYFHTYRDVLPNLASIIQGGVYLDGGLENTFVTNTFPGHRSIETGLYVESHGIVGNRFYVPAMDDFFVPWNTDIDLWDDAQPIWKVAEDNGVTSGCFNIVGCAIVEQEPTYTMGDYSDDYTLRSIIDNSTHALTNASNPANLTLAYYFQPDRTGHAFGPDSTEMRDMLAAIDVDLGYLKQQVDQMNADGGHQVDLIITADHGFLQVEEELLFINYVNDSNTRSYRNRGSVLHIWHDASLASQDALVGPLNNMRREYRGKIQIYTSGKFYHAAFDTIPSRWHYTSHQYIPPIIVVCEPGYRFTEEDDDPEFGDHGYDNALSEMHPIFVGYGPSFAEDVSVDAKVEQVDIYPLVADLVGFPPNPNNGSLERGRLLLGGSHTLQLSLTLSLMTLLSFHL